MQKTDYDIPVFQDEDVADLNEYSEEMAEALKTQIDKFGNPLTFKGSVNTLLELQQITGMKNGDIYRVIAESKNYIYNGTEWVVYSDNSSTDPILENLIEALTTPVTGEGESLSLDNTAKKRFDEFVVGGNTKQATRSGKNLLENKNSTRTINGVTFTVNEDKSITATGTATADADFYITSATNASSYSLNLNAGDYVFSDKQEGNTNTYWLFLALSNNDSATGQKYFNLVGRTNVNVPLAENNACYVMIRVKNGVTINKTFYPQLEVGSTATEYEPYGVSPSPDYPAEIGNVDNNNPNVFDSEDWYKTLNEVNSASMQKEVVNGIEYYKFKPSGIDEYQYMKGQFKPNTQYVFTAKARQYNIATQNGVGMRFHYTNGTTSGRYIAQTLEEYDYLIVSEKNKTISYIDMYYLHDNFGLMRDMQLEEGTIATPYQPFGIGYFTTKVENKNLIDINNPSSYLTGTWQVENGIGKLSGSAWQDVCWFIPIKVGEQYTFSYKERNSSNLFLYLIELDKPIKENAGATILRSIVNDGNQLKYTFTIQNDGYLYIRFCGNTTISNVSIPEIQLEKNGDKTSYLPHQSQLIDFPLAEGQVLHAGDYLAEDGIHQVKGTIVLDGSTDEAWTRSATNTSNIYSFTSSIIANIVKTPSSTDTIANIICSHFIKESANETYRKSNGIAIHSNGNIFIYDDDFKEYTTDQFTTWLSNNPITLEYELAEEVVIPYTDSQKTAYLQLQDLRSYKDKTYVYSTDDTSPIYEVEAIKSLDGII